MTARPDPSPTPTPSGSSTARAFPTAVERIPRIELNEGNYRVRFARSPEQLDALLQLRYRVFNLELEEGLDSSHLTGRDEDDFDAVCHHLLVEDRASGEVIGTYRMQTSEMAAAGRGFYTATEFDLSRLDPSVIAHGIEIGRACIAREHRRQRVLFALWKGLAAYLMHNRKHALFGCCSLTSQDADEGEAVMEWLRRGDHVAADEPVTPLDGFACRGRAPTDEEVAAVRIPPLFGTYLRYRSKVYGRPAIDRRFGTIDYLVVCDVRKLDAKTVALFFGDADMSGAGRDASASRTPGTEA